MLRIIPRSEWGAKPPTKVSKMPDSRLGWIFHYNGPPVPEHLSGKQLMQSVQRFHMGTKGWRDFAYSFGIDQDGNVYEGRGWNVVGGHTSGRFKGTGPSNNSHAHAVIFLIGQGQAPSQAAIDAATDLVVAGLQFGVPAIVTPHTEAAPGLHTSCPGPELIALVRSGYFTNPHKEPSMSNRVIVNQLYLDLLGREADEGGLNHWTKALDEKALTVDQIRWEFVKTRFAADGARITALADLLSRGASAATVSTVGTEAFEQFLDNLAAFAAQEAAGHP